MAPKKAIAATGAALLFTVGIAAAFAEDTTTTVTTTATTDMAKTVTTDTTTVTTDTTTTSTTTEDTTTDTTTSTTTTTAVPMTTITTRPAAKTSGPLPAPPRATAPSLRKPEPRARKTETTLEKSPAPRRHEKRRHRISEPLKVTPPLGQRGYVFPVVGPSGYGDTYGALRSDVRGKWHHGDDIFAPLGAPVVAVASGTVNRVGWKKLGGWRLWVRDRAANHFYYAHLSGYASTIFHSRYVEAGQVIGFVGNTGDAFPGAPHLHFEIHPHQLLRLHYDGAVNPTSYLDSWTHLDRVHAPRPQHPRLPKHPLFRRQAREVFHQLLAARNLLAPPLRTSPSGRVDVPDVRAPRAFAGALPLHEATPTAADEKARSELLVPVLAGLTSLALFGTTALIASVPRRLRRRG